MGTNSLWERFQQYFLRYDDLGFSIDISRMRFADDFFERMQPQVERAFAAMRELEGGAVANPDEKRQKTIELMKHAKPLPLERARELLKKGKL